MFKSNLAVAKKSLNTNSYLKLLAPRLCKCIGYWPSFLALYVRHCGLKALAKYGGQLGLGEGVVFCGTISGECVTEWNCERLVVLHPHA